MIKDVEEKENSRIEIDLTGPEGNAFVLLGYANQWGKQLGWNKGKRDKIKEKMMQGDYDNLVNTFDEYFGSFCTLYR